jgi:hypothetical protein
MVKKFDRQCDKERRRYRRQDQVMAHLSLSPLYNGPPLDGSGNLPFVAGDANHQSKGANLKLLSRALFALALTALAAVIVRLRGSGGTPPHRGGWRELTAADLEQADQP